MIQIKKAILSNFRAKVSLDISMENTTTTFNDEKRFYICGDVLNLEYDKIETI